jgi:putative NIF3 family GTP cyclohydrolase 1 type 2
VAALENLPIDGLSDYEQCSYPEELADRAWDNVGLLMGNSEADAKKRKPVVLVTNDLTFQVAVDAIGQGASVIVTYRMYLNSLFRL